MTNYRSDVLMEKCLDLSLLTKPALFIRKVRCLLPLMLQCGSGGWWTHMPSFFNCFSQKYNQVNFRIGENGELSSLPAWLGKSEDGYKIGIDYMF